MRLSRLRSALAAVVFAAFTATGAPSLAAPVTVSGTPLGASGAASTPAADAAIETARKSVAAGDLAGAVAQLKTFGAANPKAIEPARYLGDLYYRSGDLASAERTYLAILRQAPDDRQTHDRLGGVYAAQDRIQQALDEFQKSLPNAAAYGHIVELHRRLGDLDDLVRDYRRAADRNPFDAGAQYGAGAVLRADRKPQEAEGYLKRGLALSPSSCSLLVELGSVYLDLSRTQPATEVLQRCLAHEPNDYAALVNLGDAMIEQQRYDRARVSLDRAIAERPDGAEALVNLGYLEDEAGHWNVAVAYYLKASGADPLLRDAYVDLGYDYGEHKLFPLAEAAFLKGLSVAPDDGRLHYLLGATYAEQGKRELARSEYRRATASDEPEVAKAASRVLASLQ